MQRGFTLIELTITVAIAVLLMSGITWSISSHAAGASTTCARLNALFDAARSTAATSGNGATIVFAPAAHGFSATLYRGRPNGTPMQTTTLAPVTSDLAVTANGVAPPFTAFVSSAGGFTMQPNYPDAQHYSTARLPVLSQQPACPASGSTTLILSAAQSASRTIVLPCTLTASGTPEPLPT